MEVTRRQINMLLKKNKYIRTGASDLVFWNLNAAVQQEMILKERADRDREFTNIFWNKQKLCSFLHTICMVEYIEIVLVNI